MPPEDEDRIPRSDFERPERRFERERAARLEAEAIAEKGLVSNALKFSPARGEVRLSAAAERAGSALQLVVCVEDDGPGVPFDEQRRMFEPYAQTDTRRRCGPRPRELRRPGAPDGRGDRPRNRTGRRREVTASA
jgi:hypothetical protein